MNWKIVKVCFVTIDILKQYWNTEKLSFFKLLFQGIIEVINRFKTWSIVERILNSRYIFKTIT